MAERKVLRDGILIAIEGIDGAGKTTQSNMLCERLKKAGYSAVLLHEPTKGQWGEKIRDLAKNGRDKTSPEEELDLFYKDRVEDVKINIRPKMAEKNVVIMDRYYFSNVTYQGALGLDPDSVEKKNQEIAPQPHLVIILDIPSSVSMRRIRATREGGPNHFERTNYLEKVRKLFLQQFRNRNYVKIINGDGILSEKQVSDSVWSLVEPIVHTAEET